MVLKKTAETSLDKDEPKTTRSKTSNSTVLKGQRCYIPKRYIFVLMTFLACFDCICQYGNLSIAIVAMVNLTALSSNKSRLEECPAPMETNQSEYEGGDILWSSQHVGLVLGAIAIGSMITKIPGGRLAECFGCKKQIALSVGISSFLTLLIPVSAMWGSYPAMTVRFLIGMALGPLVPDIIFMLGHWIPKTEKNLLISLIISGFPVGWSATPFVFASLCDSNFLGGWPSVFYITGFFGLVWTFFWCVLIHEIPSQHPTISDEELQYISENMTQKMENKCLTIPWRKLMTSVPVLAFVIGYFSIFWTFAFFFTVLSLYLGTMLHMPITKNGFHSCLPHLFKFLFQWIGAYFTHWILKKNFASPNAIAKFWIATNAVMAMIWFLGITLVGCNETLVLTFLILSFLINGVADAEINTTCSNMAPSLSGTIIGIAETAGVSTMFIIPAIVGGLTDHEQTMAQWYKVFYINIAVIGATSLFFVLFGTTEAQQWAIHSDNEENST